MYHIRTSYVKYTTRLLIQYRITNISERFCASNKFITIFSITINRIMQMSPIIYILLCLHPMIECCSRNLTIRSTSPNIYTRLWSSLSVDYTHLVRPVLQGDTVTDATVDSQLYHIVDMDEAMEVGEMD